MLNKSFELQDTIWTGQPDIKRAILFNIWFYIIIFFALNISLLYDSNENNSLSWLLFYSIVVFFVGLLILHVYVFSKSIYKITSTQIIIATNLFTLRLKEITHTQIIKIEVVQYDNNSSNVLIYFHGVDIEGFQNRMILYGIPNATEVITKFLSYDSRSSNDKIQVIFR